MNRCSYIKKTECWRIDVFELWCWRRLYRVPWTARRSNQSILKEISPEYSLEGHAEAETRILWPPDVKNRLTRKDLDAGKDWRLAEKGTREDDMVGWHHQLNGHEFEETPERTGKPGVLQSMGSQRVRHSWVTEQQLLVELLLLCFCFHLVWSVCLTVNPRNIHPLLSSFS